MMDRAVGEYADLVRDLERRQSLPSSPPPLRPQQSQQDQPPPPPPKESSSQTTAVGSHASDGKLADQDRSGTSTLEALEERHAELHKLAEEFGGTSEALRVEICRLQGELEEARAELEAERNAGKEERVRLSDALTVLELLKHDDNAAAKMVSRYMYVQSSFLFPALLISHLLPTGSSPSPPQTRYKEHSSHSRRATQPRRRRYTRSSLRPKPHSRRNSARPRDCATCWTRQRSSSHGRPTAGGGRSRCGLRSSGERISWRRRSGDGCDARRRRAPGKTCQSHGGSTLSSATRASCSLSSMLRLRRGPRMGRRCWAPRSGVGSGAWQGSLRRARPSRRSWRNCALRLRDGCNLNGFWVAPRWTKMAVSYPRSLSHNRPLSGKRQHRKSRRWTQRHRLFALARPHL